MDLGCPDTEAVTLLFSEDSVMRWSTYHWPPPASKFPILCSFFWPWSRFDVDVRTGSFNVARSLAHRAVIPENIKANKTMNFTGFASLMRTRHQFWHYFFLFIYLYINIMFLIWMRIIERTVFYHIFRDIFIFSICFLSDKKHYRQNCKWVLSIIQKFLIFDWENVQKYFSHSRNGYLLNSLYAFVGSWKR